LAINIFKVKNPIWRLIFFKQNSPFGDYYFQTKIFPLAIIIFSKKILHLAIIIFKQKFLHLAIIIFQTKNLHLAIIIFKGNFSIWRLLFSNKNPVMAINIFYMTIIDFTHFFDHKSTFLRVITGFYRFYIIL
jgi:hypothetical protein